MRTFALPLSLFVILGIFAYAIVAQPPPNIRCKEIRSIALEKFPQAKSNYFFDSGSTCDFDLTLNNDFLQISFEYFEDNAKARLEFVETLDAMDKGDGINHDIDAWENIEAINKFDFWEDAVIKDHPQTDKCLLLRRKNLFVMVISRNRGWLLDDIEPLVRKLIKSEN